MTPTQPFDESAFHLRRGFRIAATALILCIGALLAQDVLPSYLRASSAPGSVVVVQVNTWSTPLDLISSQFGSFPAIR